MAQDIGLSLVVGSSDGAVRLSVAGWVDPSGARRLREAVTGLTCPPTTRLTVDVSAVDDLDPLGAAVLRDGFRRAAEFGIYYRVRGGSDAVRAVLREAGVPVAGAR